MKVTIAVLAFFATLIVTVNASSGPHDSRSLSGRHARFMQRSPTLVRKNNTKRCKSQARPVNNTTSSTTKSSSSPVSHPKPLVANNSVPPISINGLIHVNDKSCGPSGATKEITKTTGPNGNLDWLNCGINNGGWNPPMITVSDVVYEPLSKAIQSPQTPYRACSKYISLFDQYGAEHGIPSIILASIAMQESSCNPNEVGGAGEQGLMQITKDKCGGAPGGDCKEVNFNIRTAAKYFADTLNANKGNLLLAMGTYNGWSLGLTFSKATAAAHSNCCTCQNNLDYLHQVFNGWLQNRDPRSTSSPMGKYFNLDKCPNNY